MALIIVGLVIIFFTIAVFLVGRTDWTEDVSDITPFPEEVQMVQAIQKLTMILTLMLSAGTISLGLWLIVRGLAQLM